MLINFDLKETWTIFEQRFNFTDTQSENNFQKLRKSSKVGLNKSRKSHKCLDKYIYFWLAFPTYCFHCHA